MSNPEDLLTQITVALLLADLVAGQTALRRVGQHLRGTCPFCQDQKTAHGFYVYEDHFHCFSCGAHGDQVNFLMRDKGIGVESAIRELAFGAGIEIPEAMVPEFRTIVRRWVDSA